MEYQAIMRYCNNLIQLYYGFNCYFFQLFKNKVNANFMQHSCSRQLNKKPFQLPYDLLSVVVFLVEYRFNIKKDLIFFGNIFTPSDRALNTDRALFKSLTLSDTATATGTADFTTDTVT